MPTKKRRTPRAPFVMTVSATAALALGSGGCEMGETISNPWLPREEPCLLDGCEPPPRPDECPPVKPQHFDPCDAPGQLCLYDPDECGQSIEMFCDPESFTWRGEGAGFCNPPPPPPPDCPAAIPEPGSWCPEPGFECYYDDDCGGASTATCTGDWTWTVDFPDGTCNPPPPVCPAELPADGDFCDASFGGFACPYTVETPCGAQEAIATCGEDFAFHVASPTCEPVACGSHATSEACTADAGCRWLVPGCGDPALQDPGCHPAADCTADAECPAQQFCQTVVVDPCWDSACDACAAPVALCLPPS